MFVREMQRAEAAVRDSWQLGGSQSVLPEVNTVSQHTLKFNGKDTHQRPGRLYKLFRMYISNRLNTFLFCRENLLF